MKYWTISFPGECDQHVTETWSEEQILKSSWYKHWFLKMSEANKHEQINNENAIGDWIVVHWAVESDEWGIPRKDVKIGRLERKIEKLKQQRDYHKKQREHYAHVISMQPHLERRWNSYEEGKKERERIKGLEARVKEQEQLIKLLSEKTNLGTKE